MSRKEFLITQLYNDYIDVFNKEEIVLGEGNIDCRLMFIGEAPGKDEVNLGKPFVGKAGKNLSELLQYINITRKDIYITNAIKYRLSSISEKTKRKINRPAKKADIINSRNFLLKEVNIIDPCIIVTLGNVPLHSILGDFAITIGDCHGQSKKITVDNKEFTLVPLYHPASIIYNRSLKDVFIEDLYKLKNLFNS